MSTDKNGLMTDGDRDLMRACRNLAKARDAASKCQCSFTTKVMGDCSHLNSIRATENEIVDHCMSYFDHD